MTTVLGMTKEGELLHKIGNGNYPYTKLNKDDLKSLNLLVNEGIAIVVKKGMSNPPLIQLTDRGRVICNEC
jgi:hypothetical protein